MKARTNWSEVASVTCSPWPILEVEIRYSNHLGVPCPVL